MARNIYNILRLGTQIKSRRLKLLGIWLFHVLGKRYIGIFLDPVLACNFRCKMCYFSDEQKRKSLRGTLKYEEIEAIAGSLFHRALKLQVGCGAEPTLHKDLVKIIALGKRYNVPYVSLTTNGNLLTKELLAAAVKNGLDELTLSAHGFTRETYEYLMTNGKFDLFCKLLANVTEIKKQYPQFKLRINYTINNNNIEELSRIWEVVGDELDILQLRPIQKIGESEYRDFDLTNIHARYDAVLVPLIEECRRRHITCLLPTSRISSCWRKTRRKITASKRLHTAMFLPRNAGKMISITGRRHSSHMLLPITWEENCFGRSSDEKPAGKRM